MSEVTYARLEETLISLGFSPCGVHEKNKIFRHGATGALVIYPEFPSGNAVLPRHLLAPAVADGEQDGILPRIARFGRTKRPLDGQRRKRTEGARSGAGIEAQVMLALWTPNRALENRRSAVRATP